MKKVILLASGLLCSSLVFASDPAAIDSLINLQGVVISANKVQVNRSSVPLTISVIDREQIEASSESALLPVLSNMSRIVCDAKGNYRFWSFGRSGRYG